MSDRFTRGIYRALASGRDLSAEQEAHLAACDACRTAADRARVFELELHRELAELRAPMPADPLAVTESGRPMRWAPILAASLVFVAGATVAGVAVLPPPVPSPSLSASPPMVESTPTVLPSSSIQADPQPGDYLFADLTAVPLFDRPDGDAFTAIQPGSDMYVLDARDGWFEVQALSAETFEYLFGWVDAREDLGLREPVVCPVSPEDGPYHWAIALGHPQLHLDCLGDTGEVVLEGYAIDVGAGPSWIYSGEPEWLAGAPVLELSSVIGPAATGASLALHLPPDRDLEIPRSDREGIEGGSLLAVTGHFDDDRSPGCDRRPVREAYPAVEPERAELWCRQQFVVDRVEVLEPGPTPGPSPNPESTWPSVAEVVEDGIRVRLELTADRGIYGERTWGRVTIENIGADNVYWQAGGCAFPASVEVVPDEPWTLSYGRTWTDETADFIKSSVLFGFGPTPDDQEITTTFTPEAWVDFEGNVGCTTDWKLGTMAPGDVLTHTAAWDHDGPYKMPAPVGGYEVSARFPYYGRGSEPPLNIDIMEQELEVTAAASHQVVGDPIQVVSPADAVDAALADPGFFAAIPSARSRWAGRELIWVDGTWQLLVHLEDPDQTVRATIHGTSGAFLGWEIEVRTEPPHR